MRPFRAADAAQYAVAIGVDEVGRGALCGPVVVAAAWFAPAVLPAGLLEALDDSKRLDAPERARLAQALAPHAQAVLIGASASRIDALGVRAATLEAMTRAALLLRKRREVRSRRGASLVLIDGRDAPPGMTEAGLRTQALIGGERLAPQIAAASIIAKVARDGLMRRLAPRWPGYGWETNVGYGVPAHLDALGRLGPTPHHRRSFAPVAAAFAAARR